MLGLLLGSGLALVLLPQALAEQADRRQPITLESDKPCVVNLKTQSSVCSGNVVVNQGTLQLRAERLELHQLPGGNQQMQAEGVAGQPAHFRQKRDGVNEFVDGQALRIDYDSNTGILKFEGNAMVRRLRGTTPADEIHGSSIVWNSQREVFNVQGGAATAANPGGRVRAVITPRPAEDAAPAAAAPAPALRTSPALGDRR